MKIKIFVAFIATAAIVFISCNWFRSNKKEVSNPLVGEWKLDSVSFVKDTGVAYFLLGPIEMDSVEVEFTKDTLFTRSNNQVDTVEYSFDAKSKQLQTQNSDGKVWSFAKLSDSLMSLSTKDSAILYFRKK